MAKKSSTIKVMGGLGVAALAAAAAGVYYFAGPKGKKRQAQLKTWAGKAKKDMIGKIRQMKQVTETAYSQAAREILAKYSRAKKISPKELAALGAELKRHWRQIARDVARLGTKTSGKKQTAKRKK